MTQQNSLTPATNSLSRLAARFEEWRNDPKKSRRIPQELWQAAVDLSKEYSINYVSKALRLSYTDLKKRINAESKENLPTIKTQSRMKFIELGLEKPSSIPECTVEMEDGSGAKMRIHLRGRTYLDLCELGRTFWSKRS
jgi:hypothetical protein